MRLLTDGHTAPYRRSLPQFGEYTRYIPPLRQGIAWPFFTSKGVSQALYEMGGARKPCA